MDFQEVGGFATRLLHHGGRHPLCLHIGNKNRQLRPWFVGEDCAGPVVEDEGIEQVLLLVPVEADEVGPLYSHLFDCGVSPREFPLENPVRQRHALRVRIGVRRLHGQVQGSAGLGVQHGEGHAQPGADGIHEYWPPHDADLHGLAADVPAVGEVIVEIQPRAGEKTSDILVHHPAHFQHLHHLRRRIPPRQVLQHPLRVVLPLLLVEARGRQLGRVDPHDLPVRRAVRHPEVIVLHRFHVQRLCGDAVAAEVELLGAEVGAQADQVELDGPGGFLVHFFQVGPRVLRDLGGPGCLHLLFPRPDAGLACRC
mmetsp:Transcript_77960/g.208375  ORF Transcript_77960/g.208375 Transcript_77960/m.208375 type:complete len:311 (-) Transcript_77960:484-1416(-)